MPRMPRAIWIALVVVAGCDRRPAPTPAPIQTVTIDAALPLDAPGLERDLPQLALRSLSLYQEVVAAFAAAGEDCAAAASQLGGLRERYRDVVTANEKILRDGRARELRAALAPHEEQFDTSAKAIVQSATLSACSQDAAFARAFDQLVGAPP
jgi:hypothetical protein